MTSPEPTAKAEARQSFASRLLAWYDRHHRDLPWRIPPAAIAGGARPDPYRVWLSEVMLQQTTVTAVRAYYARFTTQWPDVGALAATETDDVMKAWAGLGYYSRARKLKECANLVAGELGGRFPDTEDGLLALPGVGPYTAAAIAAIAFNRPAAVVDGNVERVVTRLQAIATPLPQGKAEVRRFVESVLPPERPGDFAQAMMDLGATICTPRRPACVLCPVGADCAARAAAEQELYPVTAAKTAKPHRRGAAFVAVRDDGAVLLRKRPERGLLGGMAEPPTTDWTAGRDGADGVEAAPLAADWRKAGEVRHVFTHFELTLNVFAAPTADFPPPPGHWWSAARAIHSEALPSVMKKVIEAAIPGATKAPPEQRRPQENGRRPGDNA